MGLNFRPAFLLSLPLFITTVNTQSLNNVQSLYRDLFSNYTKEIMPMSDYSQPLNVDVIMFLGSINSFKEVEETVSLIAVFWLHWIDPSLAWNSSSYGNLESFVIDPKDMWLPPLYLINREDKLEAVGHDATFLTTLVSTGNVNYVPGDNLRAKCSVDIAKFPYDTQECTIQILPWGIDSSRLTFTSLKDKAQLDWYTANSDWELIDYSTKVITRNNYNLFTFSLKIKRQPLYYSLIIILPTLLFALLNPQVFALPVESGERISLALTILLSYAIFLTIVAASIPEKSSPMCVLLVVMIVIISISGIIAFGVIQSAKFYHLDNIDNVWRIVKRITTWMVKKNNNAVVPLKTEKEILISGKDISNTLDSICFYGAYICIIITVSAYFVYVFI